MTALPYRGIFGEPRPPEIAGLTLPPRPMPGRLGLTALKAWRYVGVYGDDLMLCIASVRIGPARQSFWGVWDRQAHRLFERTRLGRGAVTLTPGRAVVRERDVQIDVELSESNGVETICRSGDAYAWTRKQGGIEARARVAIHGDPRVLHARAVIDDTAGYYERQTSWRWCAGVGRSADGREAAWNLVVGVNDPPERSERTMWLDGVPTEAPPCTFADDLSSVDALRFTAEAVRERDENLLLVRSSYRQPFGTFSGELPGGISLAEGYGVMEVHDARW